jgi:hypothetical protein
LHSNSSSTFDRRSVRTAPGQDRGREAPDAPGSSAVSVAVGYQDGSCWLYQLMPELWAASGEGRLELDLLQQLIQS